MFTPKWKKNAKLLYKGAKKFIHYKRDLLATDRIAEIESRRSDLLASIKSSDKQAANEAGKLLEKTCEEALPRARGNNALQENLETIFVALVVALGIRTYFLQPFRIPTNSMYPTLNGITGQILPKAEWPNPLFRLAQHATHGRNYFSLKTDKECYITNIEEYTTLHFFPRVKISFSDGSSKSFSGSSTTLFQGGLTQLLDNLIKEQHPHLSRRFSQLTPEHRQQAYSSPINTGGGKAKILLSSVKIPANTVIAEGYSQTGDLILVDKMSYHFRKPTNGEVFVFDTRDIKMKNLEENTHYIKRLVGSPGDKLLLKPTTALNEGYDNANILFRNNMPATEPGVLKVQSQKDGYNSYGSLQSRLEARMKLGVNLKDKPSTGMSEYWAMGDNSFNSSDSRDWGTVKEFNVVGPAFFSLWPFGSGHWGTIK